MSLGENIVALRKKRGLFMFLNGIQRFLLFMKKIR